jgi:hypothetical protein
VLFLLAATVRGDEPKKQTGSPDPGPRNPEPAFLVRAEVNKSMRDYREDDEISVRVATEEDAYVYVWYQQADGQILQIFPNKYQPKNLVPARQTAEIPARDDTYRWHVAAPFGTERIKVLASRTPLKSLSDAAFVRARFNPVSAQQVKGVELELGPEKEKPPEWTECLLEFNTYGRDQAPRPATARRFGVFFGVSEYLFNAEYELAVKRSLNLEGCNRDARNFAALMREVGELSNPLRVYTNTLATRRQMEFAITDWLPSVSRPGDTVFIFFAGHGMLLPPPLGSKPDGESLLTPYDAVTRDILAQLLDRRRKEQQQLLEAPDVQLASWLTVDRRGADALVRHTCVSDVEFAHWLQRLDGRQVVIILDCCHSGGFAEAEKGVGGRPREVPFNFLRRQVVRLKGIGQRECAVLAACGKQQTSKTRKEGDMGVLTHSLTEAIRETRGPLEITRAHQECQAKMKKYFDSWIPEAVEAEYAARVKQKPETANEDPAKVKAGIKAQLEQILPHEPMLYHTCTQPVYIKP